jgi:SAM-dependent methyltransferase
MAEQAGGASGPREGVDDRLIDWTGERCVPWVEDSAMLYEHFHRYLWAARHAGGRRVLDLGSGEGFGAAILADAGAVEVVGVDVDPLAVEHAVRTYARSGLSFVCASALDLGSFEPQGFDLVVAFEMIEHVTDQERLLAEVERVLSPHGLLVVSTPDAERYSAASGQSNPFHERELSRAEFTSLLGSRFANVALWGQRTITGSYLSAVGSGTEATTSEDFFVTRRDGSMEAVAEGEPLFYVALASNADLPPRGHSSTLADHGLELVHETARAHGVAVAERDRLLAQANQHLAQANRTLDERYEKIVELDGELARTRERLDEAQAFATRIEQSVSWQAFQRARVLLYRVIGEDSRAARALSAGLRLAGRLTMGLGRR